MIQEIKDWWANHKAKVHQQRKERINNEVNEDYNVIERNGNLYLMVGSRAAAKFDGASTVTEVIAAIKKARNSQIEFKKNEI